MVPAPLLCCQLRLALNLHASHAHGSVGVVMTGLRSTACILRPRGTRRVWVHFGGVNNAFYAWLNGHLLGYSQDSCCPAEFEVTSALQAGENMLAVQASTRLQHQLALACLEARSARVLLWQWAFAKGMWWHGAAEGSQPCARTAAGVPLPSAGRIT